MFREGLPGVSPRPRPRVWRAADGRKHLAALLAAQPIRSGADLRTPTATRARVRSRACFDRRAARGIARRRSPALVCFFLTIAAPSSWAGLAADRVLVNHRILTV